jgi:AraC-like DNA-binding protein
VPESLPNPFAAYLLPYKAFSPAGRLDQLPLPLIDPIESLQEFAAPAGGVFSLDLNPLGLIAFRGPAASFRLPPSSWLSLVYLTAGELSLFEGRLHRKVCAGSALLVPGQRCVGSSNGISLVALLLPLDAIAWLCQSLLPDSPASFNAGWIPPAPRRCQSGQNPDDDALLHSLQQLLQLLAETHQRQPALVQQLGLVQVLTRVVLLLAFPWLRQNKASAKPMPAAMPPGDPFEQLIAYIKANLDQPLNLTLLEQRSHYSRRALQYAFQQRLGCTATQWIRAQRLDLAQRRLSNPSAHATVATIAHDCGYRSMGLFSIEFQQRFHIKPSQLLRRARAERSS